MSKYSDVVALLDYFDKKNVMKPRQRGHRQYREDDKDPISHIIQMKRMVDEYNKIMADIEKVNKKEDKKEPEKSWWDKQSFIQKVAILTMTVPLSMMAMCIVVLEFVKIIKMM